MTYDGSADEIGYVEIYPPIGIARVGNSTFGDTNEDYFIGPEVPGNEPTPPGGFKDLVGNIKKQAVRFRVYAFKNDGTILGELDDPEEYTLTWKVCVANKKAAWVTYPYQDTLAGSALRNAGVQGWPDGNPPATQAGKHGHLNSRNRLIIRGENEIVGANKKNAFLNGTFGGGDSGITETPVTLGELRTDERGRLLVLASDGDSFPVNGPRTLQNQFNNDGWVDKMCDGTVQVTVTSETHPEHAITVKNGATIITAPPRFVSGTHAPTTLYELIEDIYERRNEYNFGAVNYHRDIYPLFKRIYMLSWTSKEAARGHGPSKMDTFNEPELSNHQIEADESIRNHIFGRIRSPGPNPNPQAENYGPPNMPDLAGAVLTQLQYKRLEKWAAGDFQPGVETDQNPYKNVEFDQINLGDQPSALTRAALEWSIGGSFGPGIECDRIVKDNNTYKEVEQPGDRFRFADTVTPGDLTKGLSLPWQSDFYACIGNWWPSVRPFNVVTWERFNEMRNNANPPIPPGMLARRLQLTTPANRLFWARGVLDTSNLEGMNEGGNINLDRVRKWFKLGFVTKQSYGADTLPEILVETQRSLDL